MSGQLMLTLALWVTAVFAWWAIRAHDRHLERLEERVRELEQVALEQQEAKRPQEPRYVVRPRKDKPQ